MLADPINFFAASAKERKPSSLDQQFMKCPNTGTVAESKVAEKKRKRDKKSGSGTASFFGTAVQIVEHVVELNKQYKHMLIMVFKIWP